MQLNTVFVGDVLDFAEQLGPESVNTIVTSPPYWGLRDYGDDRQLGLEPTVEDYICNLTVVFRALRRGLRKDGTLWLNLGDTYRKGQLIGVPWRVALALQADGWVLRSDVIWEKPNAMPESVKNRPTTSHEYLFLLSRSGTYHYDIDAIREPHTDLANLARYRKPTRGTQGYPRASGLAGNPQQDNYTGVGFHPKGRNKRTVWSVVTVPSRNTHYATFPPELVRPCIRAGSPLGGVVCDPFLGSGTTAQVAEEEGRFWIGCDLDQRSPAFTAERLSAIKTA